MITISCNSFKFNRIFQSLTDQILRVEIYFSILLFLEKDLVLFYYPSHIVLLLRLVVSLRKVSKLIN